MRTMAFISVLAWLGFALFYRIVWPGASAPGEDLGVFALFLAAGTLAFVAMAFGLFRAFDIPPAWRASAAVALTAPALCCDVLTSIFFESWYPNGGAANDRLYAALIFGGVGTIQLVVLLTSAPEVGRSAR
jgi:hypothetical protein